MTMISKLRKRLRASSIWRMSINKNHRRVKIPTMKGHVVNGLRNSRLTNQSERMYLKIFLSLRTTQEISSVTSLGPADFHSRAANYKFESDDDNTHFALISRISSLIGNIDPPATIIIELEGGVMRFSNLSMSIYKRSLTQTPVAIAVFAEIQV